MKPSTDEFSFSSLSRNALEHLVCQFPSKKILKNLGTLSRFEGVRQLRDFVSHEISYCQIRDLAIWQVAVATGGSSGFWQRLKFTDW
jgi:hypothetical protein